MPRIFIMVWSLHSFLANVWIIKASILTLFCEIIYNSEPSDISCTDTNVDKNIVICTYVSKKKLHADYILVTIIYYYITYYYVCCYSCILVVIPPQVLETLYNLHKYCRVWSELKLKSFFELKIWVSVTISWWQLNLRSCISFIPNSWKRLACSYLKSSCFSYLMS